jgi:hypothetical protein
MSSPVIHKFFLSTTFVCMLEFSVFKTTFARTILFIYLFRAKVLKFNLEASYSKIFVILNMLNYTHVLIKSNVPKKNFHDRCSIRLTNFEVYIQAWGLGSKESDLKSWLSCSPDRNFHNYPSYPRPVISVTRLNWLRIRTGGGLLWIR